MACVFYWVWTLDQIEEIHLFYSWSTWSLSSPIGQKCTNGACLQLGDGVLDISCSNSYSECLLPPLFCDCTATLMALKYLHKQLFLFLNLTVCLHWDATIIIGTLATAWLKTNKKKNSNFAFLQVSLLYRKKCSVQNSSYCKQQTNDDEQHLQLITLIEQIPTSHELLMNVTGSLVPIDHPY